jgi:hypothetical protein
VEAIRTKEVNSTQRCPVCESSAIRGVLSRKNVPAHQNALNKDPLAATNVTRGDLDIVICESCGFVFNRAFDISRVKYGAGYGDASSPSPSVNAYLDEHVRNMIEESGIRNCHIIEIGGGQGLFLRKLIEFENSGNVGQGFDPSHIGDPFDLDGRLRFERRFYDSNCTTDSADVVVMRHVIEHIPDPASFLRGVCKTVASARNAKVFCETPCVEWILRNKVIWDFYYEHCSYFSAQSLTNVFEIAGFRVENVRHVFKGQYLWLEATLRDSYRPSAVKKPGPAVALASNFACAQREVTEEWSRAIKKLSSKERIALWGAGAKGVTFANVIDPRREFIDCLVDPSPYKQGRFVPGTGHPVVSPEQLTERAVSKAILMNPNYRRESLAILQKAGVKVRFVGKISKTTMKGNAQ